MFCKKYLYFLPANLLTAGLIFGPNTRSIRVLLHLAAQFVDISVAFFVNIGHNKDNCIYYVYSLHFLALLPPIYEKQYPGYGIRMCQKQYLQDTYNKRKGGGGNLPAVLIWRERRKTLKKRRG